MMQVLDKRSELDTPYQLPASVIAEYQKCGVVKLKNVLSPATIEDMNAKISKAVLERYDAERAFENAPSKTYAKAFQQVMNIWVSDKEVERLVFSKRLAKIACELMKTEGVRIYHDQALYKEAGGGHTPWHADQYYWPLSNKNTCTVWIPLQEVSLEMGPLSFSKGSQINEITQNDGITEQSDELILKKVEGFPYLSEAFDLGEVSFHSGGVFHNAGANKTPRARKAMTIIYMDSNMRMTEPTNENQQKDAKMWLPGVRAGELCASELNPILYSQSL